MPETDLFVYNETARLNIEGGVGAYIVQENFLKIEEGTRIVNNSKTWEHTVNKRDKRIELTNSNGTVELRVIKREAPEPRPDTTKGHYFPTLIDDVGMRGSIPAEAAVPDGRPESKDPSIVPSGFNISFESDNNCAWIINDSPDLILTDDYHFRAYPTTGLAPSIHIGFRTNALRNITGPELIALETLREIISEKDFRKYLKDGFLLVKGGSGMVYQIYRDRTHIKVWEHGKRIEEICVYFKNRKIPQTDKVLAFKIMIESDENAFKKLGNVYNMRRAA